MTNIKDTIFLPKTDYQLRADFLKTEPELIAQWEIKDVYNKRNENKAEVFVLHSGPPYANGNSHLGHSLNLIHKSVISNAQAMAGKNSNFIPGWDCHGLPIEWKIEENYRAAGKNKNDVPVVEFRKECREYAQQWANIQSKEFQRLGILADWKNPYLTMNYETEAYIAEEVRKFADNGTLYRDFRPVLWSPVEQTSLAEAEVEYEDREITTIYVKFPIKYSSIEKLKDASFVAYTTTPWTIPCNRALAINEKILYALVTVSSPNASNKQKFIIARNLVEDFCKQTNIKIFSDSKTDWYFDNHDIIECEHPIKQFTNPVPVLFGDFVTDETGTGVVHIAPSHGLDDFYICKQNGIELTDYVTKNGTYKSDLLLFGGLHVYKALEPVLTALKNSGTLVASKQIIHSTALSWRSKASLIYLATPQWFISMDHREPGQKSIREKCLDALKDVQFIPEGSWRRLTSMIMNRPDWCISRQRTWGVPITLFFNKLTGKILRDEEVDTQINLTFYHEGSDAWYAKPASWFLSANEDANYNPDDYEMIMDVVDVWFESGASYDYVLEDRNLPKADIYLEGSDQHRGWFQSSLIQSVATRGIAQMINNDKNFKVSKIIGSLKCDRCWKVNVYGNLGHPIEYNSQHLCERCKKYVYEEPKEATQ